MEVQSKVPETESPNKPVSVKVAYVAPKLNDFGSIRTQTRSGNGSGGDGGAISGMTMVSDRRLKTNIFRVGTHPLGVGLYLFNYIAEVSSVAGHGRQFGVMADEVEACLPDAVITCKDGFKRVNYAMLGIDLPAVLAH